MGLLAVHDQGPLAVDEVLFSVTTRTQRLGAHLPQRAELGIFRVDEEKIAGAHVAGVDSLHATEGANVDLQGGRQGLVFRLVKARLTSQEGIERGPLRRGDQRVDVVHVRAAVVEHELHHVLQQRFRQGAGRAVSRRRVGQRVRVNARSALAGVGGDEAKETTSLRSNGSSSGDGSRVLQNANFDVLLQGHHCHRLLIRHFVVAAGLFGGLLRTGDGQNVFADLRAVAVARHVDASGRSGGVALLYLVRRTGAEAVGQPFNERAVNRLLADQRQGRGFRHADVPDFVHELLTDTRRAERRKRIANLSHFLPQGLKQRSEFDGREVPARVDRLNRCFGFRCGCRAALCRRGRKIAHLVLHLGLFGLQLQIFAGQHRNFSEPGIRSDQLNLRVRRLELLNVGERIAHVLRRDARELSLQMLLSRRHGSALRLLGMVRQGTLEAVQLAPNPLLGLPQFDLEVGRGHTLCCKGLDLAVQRADAHEIRVNLTDGLKLLLPQRLKLGLCLPCAFGVGLALGNVVLLSQIPVTQLRFRHFIRITVRRRPLVHRFFRSGILFGLFRLSFGFAFSGVRLLMLKGRVFTIRYVGLAGILGGLLRFVGLRHIGGKALDGQFIHRHILSHAVCQYK